MDSDEREKLIVDMQNKLSAMKVSGKELIAMATILPCTGMVLEQKTRTC